MQNLQEQYDIELGDLIFTYEFTSVGKKGAIRKMVQYTEINMHNTYNLAFGDKNELGEIDDLAVSDNGDGQKVLATVVSTLYALTNQNPDFLIFATGSTAVRNRLYRIGIAKNIDEVREDFHIFGFLDEEWEEFELNKPYSAFFVKRKNN
jgi:hypothetical protein